MGLQRFPILRPLFFQSNLLIQNTPYLLEQMGLDLRKVGNQACFLVAKRRQVLITAQEQAEMMSQTDAIGEPVVTPPNPTAERRFSFVRV